MILNLARYLLLGVLILFVYRVIKLIARDLEATSNTFVAKAPLNSPQRLKDQPVRNPVELVLLEGADPAFKAGESLQLRNKVTIGRGPENNLVLQSTTISKKHTHLWEDRGQWWIEDYDSKNGTYVNDNRIIKPVALANGDKIKLGDFVFQFVRWDYEIQ